MESIINESIMLQQKAKILIDDLKITIDNFKQNDKVIFKIKIFLNLKKGLEQEKRILNNLYSAIIKVFQEKVLVYQTAQADLKNFKKNLILRQAEIIINRKLTEGEIENVVSNPQVKHIILKSKKDHSIFNAK